MLWSGVAALQSGGADGFFGCEREDLGVPLLLVESDLSLVQFRPDDVEFAAVNFSFSRSRS